jgi:polysaccharide export outer membrane protein
VSTRVRDPSVSFRQQEEEAARCDLSGESLRTDHGPAAIVYSTIGIVILIPKGTKQIVSCSEKGIVAFSITTIVSLGLSFFPGPATADDQARGPAARDSLSEYLLGSQDQLVIRVADLEETPNTPLRIDPSGNVDLPLIGPVHAAGLTISDFRAQLTEKFRKYVHEPLVTVTVTEFHSQPVTVVGAVKSPGVHQVEGPKRLLEIISMAGGLSEEAGSRITITRELSSGPLPLPEARIDVGGRFAVADIEITGLMASTSPSKNIIIRPSDIVSVSIAEIVYVVGEVKKPGGFTLHSHATVSVLEALGMAEGLAKTASPKNARIMRVVGDGKNRAEIRADISKIMDGKSPDIPLQANDILVIPNNVPRAAVLRGMEAAIQLTTGVLIYRSIY